MAPRPYWKGFLKLSLVSCPIGLYPAISAAEKISFRHVNRETGNRLHQQYVDAVSGEVVEGHNKGRGYEVSDNQFLIVPEEELEAAQQEPRKRPFSAATLRPPEQSVLAPATRRQSAEAEGREHKSKRGSLFKVVEKREDEAPPVAPPTAVPRPILGNTRTIQLDRFFAPDQIDSRYYQTPY